MTHTTCARHPIVEMELGRALSRATVAINDTTSLRADIRAAIEEMREGRKAFSEAQTNFYKTLARWEKRRP